MQLHVRGHGGHHSKSAYRAFNIAVKRAAFIFRRFFALGFSKRRCKRTCCRVCSRSSFFLSRRRALSTASPFFSFTSLINNLSLACFAFRGCFQSRVSRPVLLSSKISQPPVADEFATLFIPETEGK